MASSTIISMPAPPRDLIRFLKRFDPAIRELALEARELVLRVLAPSNESILDVYVLAMNYGFSERIKDQVVYIGVYAKHINLGFYWGAEMDDPQGVLEGGGKQLRHIKITSQAELGTPDCSRLPPPGGSRWVGAIQDLKKRKSILVGALPNRLDSRSNIVDQSSRSTSASLVRLSQASRQNLLMAGRECHHCKQWIEQGEAHDCWNDERGRADTGSDGGSAGGVGAAA